MTTKEVARITIATIAEVNALKLKTLCINIVFSTENGLDITVFSKPSLDNLSFYVYFDDDMKEGKERINKLIEAIKLDDYEEIIRLHMRVN